MKALAQKPINFAKSGIQTSRFCQNGSKPCLRPTFCHSKTIGTTLAINQVDFENKKNKKITL